MQDEDVDGVPIAAGLDGRRARVARCRAHDRHPRIPPRQLVLEQRADQLQRDVLERQRRAVEELEQVIAIVERMQGHDVRVVERRVGLVDQRLELVTRERALDERPHDLDGHVLVAGLGESVGGAGRQPRPPLGHVQPAVGRETGEQGVGELEHRRVAARAHVVHVQTVDSVPSTRMRLLIAPHGVELTQRPDRRLHVALAREVRDEHDARRVAPSLLLHRRDRHLVVTEHARDGGEYAGPVDGVDAEVVLGGELVDRPDAPGAEMPDGGVRLAREVERGVDHVAEHGARGRITARAPPVEHQLAHRRTLHEHCVEALAHRRQRVRQRAARRDTRRPPPRRRRTARRRPAA